MAREIVHVGRKIQVALDTETLPDGTTVRRDAILHPGAVAILPRIDAGHVCLLQNERPVVESTLWEIPAGTLEPGEPPAEAARRELAEETGYRAAKWTQIGEIIPSPGVLSEKIWLFLAEELTQGEMALEPDEELEPKTVALADAYRWLTDGTITDAKTLIALYWLRDR